MVEISIKTPKKGLKESLKKLEAMLSLEKVDRIIEKVGARTHLEAVRETPKKFTGQTRRSWQLVRAKLGKRIVLNDSKVMGYLEFGTANKGRGFIYPKRAKALFIPLTAKGFHSRKGKFGVDFIFAKRVRGIKPRGISKKVAKFSGELLKKEITSYVKQSLRA